MTFAYRLPDIAPTSCVGCNPGIHEACESCPGPRGNHLLASTIWTADTPPDMRREALQSIPSLEVEDAS